MNERRLAYIAGLAAALILGVGTVLKLAIRLHNDAARDGFSSAHPGGTPPALALAHTQSLALVPSASQSKADSFESNVLELPKASLDFVGFWGGYTHSTLHSVRPEFLTGENPDRASIIFGRQGDTVFIAGELYSSPSQRILGRPRASVLSPVEAIVHYEADDAELHYNYTCRFTLVDSSRIVYRNAVEVYNRRSGNLIGTVKQRAILRRLLTTEQQRRFARPSRHELPQKEISASTSFAH
ncbi:MAG TPA: hypothetical protein VEF07_02945 [Candidatus Binataceae bacterium]|nr:hypothetical protein [Candidatus Binataceae bacterium]